MKSIYLSLLISACLLVACDLNATMNGCPDQVQVINSSINEIVVTSNTEIKQLSPEFFSFNLEWIPFQSGFWNEQTGQVNPDLIKLLKPFAGAIYRYPGGTISNHFDWAGAVGASNTRPLKKYANWAPPFQALFGVDEYLSFVKQVNGRAWYVANLYGNLEGEQSDKAVTESISKLADYLLKKQQAGLPAIYKWELGNELDRDIYKWSPDKLSSKSLLAINAIKHINPNAEFVALLEDYPAQKVISETEYNRRIVSTLYPKVSEFAKHLYYDGQPSGPPIPHRLNSICSSINISKNLFPDRPITIWMTEHARVPPNAFVDPGWKRYWKQTADLEAAIGVADMTIATAQVPEVRGTFIHSIHATDGPWPLFHRNNEQGLNPSIVYYSLEILKGSMLEYVLPTVSKSANNSAYEGGYDLRSLVMTNKDRNQYSVWAINRSNKEIKVRLTLPQMSNKSVDVNNNWISDINLHINNYSGLNLTKPKRSSYSIYFDINSSTDLVLPPQSINSFKLKLQS